MSLGDFLTGIDDSIDNWIGSISPSYQKMLDEERNQKAQDAQILAASPDQLTPELKAYRQKLEHPSFFQNGGQDLGFAFAGLSDIPGFGPLMNVLDAPRRAIDTALITAQHSESFGARNDTSQWGEMFNGAAWARAWDMASWDNMGEAATGGAIVTQTAFRDPSNPANQLDPLDVAEAKKLQELATSSWYGATMTTAIDLGTSFISLPGTGVLARGRKARASITIDQADQMAERFAEVGEVGRTAGQKAADLAKTYANPTGMANVDGMIARQMDGLRKLDGITDESQIFNQLKARLETAPDGVIANMSNVFAEINKIPDVAVRERVRMNYWLSNLGSAKAKVAFIEDAPLIAKNFENLVRAPREHAALTEIYTSRLAGGVDLPINDVVEKVWKTSADKAEEAALKEHIGKLRTSYSDHARLVRELKDLKPKVLDTDVSKHVKAQRAKAAQDVQDLTEELRKAKADLKGTRRWAAGAAEKAAGSGLDDVTGAARQQGAAMRGIDDAVEGRAAANADVATTGRRVKEAGKTRNWIEAEYRQAKELVRSMNADEVPAQLKQRLASLEKELDGAKKGQDYARLASARAKLVREVRRADALGVDFDRQMLARADELEQAARKEFAAGPLAEHGDLHAAVGDARRRVEDLTARLEQAKNDRKLLDETPLSDPQEMVDWLDSMDEARGLRQESRDALRAGLDEQAQARAALKAKEDEIAAVSTVLNRNNRVINAILEGTDEGFAVGGNAAPKAIERVKAHLREKWGAEHYVVAGDGNTIVRVKTLPGHRARSILSPAARGQVSINEVGLGQRQLEDAMLRSKAFTPEEITHWKTAFVRADASERIGIVARMQEQMAGRVAQRFFAKRFPDLTEEEALKHAKEVSELSLKHWGQGNDWVIRAADEQVKDGVVFVRDLEGQITAYDGPMLRSQLADSAPMLDPQDMWDTLVRHESTIRGNLSSMQGALTNLHDTLVDYWKVGALLRPGLMFRSMADTGPRALASMSAGEAFVTTVNGTVNTLRNNSLKGLVKLRLSKKTPDQVAAELKLLGLRPIKAGGKEWRFAQDHLELNRSLSATTKGNTVHGAFLPNMQEAYNGLKIDRASWARRKADSIMWHLGYEEYAKMLLASPSANRLAKLMHHVDDVGLGADEIIERLRKTPEFKAEYRDLAQPMGRTEEEFVQQLVHEVELMFPDKKLLDAALNDGLHKGLVDRLIPKAERFDVPSPELSALEGGKIATAYQKVTDKAFRALLDKPDMWLARNPVVVRTYQGNVRREVRDLMRRHGPDYELTAAQVRAIDRKARNEAIGYVRNTFFDTTRYTGLHRAVTRFSPFVAAWEDAMISWGRLIYDDPRRLTKLAAAYHSPYTVDRSNPDMTLVVGWDGQQLTRGSDAEGGVFVNVPAILPGVDKYKVRLDAINSIAQGETWWLPGVGPTVQVPATWAMGSGQVPGLDKETALEIIDSDNPLMRAVLKSVWLGGEVPASDAGSLAHSTLPGWVKTTVSETMGNGFIRNRQTTFDYLYNRAIANGEEPGAAEIKGMWDQATKTARMAAIVRVGATAGFGLSGSASVDGQFYVDQMRIIQSMTDEQRGGLTAEEFFAQQFPEIGGLSGSISKNESGLQATIDVGKAEGRLAPVLQDYKVDLGWMVVGADNLADGEFSRTTYQMQMTRGGRRYMSSQEAQFEAQANAGYRTADSRLNVFRRALIEQGVPEEEVDANPLFRRAKTAVYDQIAMENPAFAEKRASFTDKFDYYYSSALEMSQDKRLAGRSDMEAFRTYDEARRQVMTFYGVTSVGQSPEAKAVLYQYGSMLAAENLGFQQMWDRFLEREVD